MSPSYLDSTRASDMTMTGILERRASQCPDDTFFSWADSSTTVGEFNAQVNRMARHLVRQGIGAGTHVAVLMDSSPDYLALWFALAKINAVEIPVNTAYHGELLRHQLASGAATVCCADSGYADKIDEISADVPALTRTYVRGTTVPGSAVMQHDFGSLLADEDPANLGHESRHDTIAGIIFTSGTTGPSKGVLLTHHYLAAYGAMYADINGLRADDVLLNFLPFFHIGAKFLTIATLICGGRMRL